MEDGNVFPFNQCYALVYINMSHTSYIYTQNECVQCSILETTNIIFEIEFRLCILAKSQIYLLHVLQLND